MAVRSVRTRPKVKIKMHMENKNVFYVVFYDIQRNSERCFMIKAR